MKKVLFVLVLSLTFTFLSPLREVYSKERSEQYKSISKEITDLDIERIEYLYIEEQWFQFTYYKDGSITIVPTNSPPNY